MHNNLQIVILTIGKKERKDIRKIGEKRLQVLLEKKTFSLPIFEINYGEYIRDTVINIVEKILGISKMYIQQLYAWGDPKYYTDNSKLSITYLVIINRNNIKKTDNKYEFFDIKVKDKSNTNKIKIQEVILSNINNEYKYNINTRRKNHDGNMEYIYYLDNKDKDYELNAIILHRALKTLRNRIESTNIAFNFIDKEFTLTELQQVYELILRKELIKGNFRKKISPMVTKTDSIEKESAYRPSQKFKFDENWVTDWV